MVPSRSLSSILALPALAFLSLSASALPHPRTASSTAALKLAVRINSHGTKNIAAADRARIQALQAGGSSSVDATNAVAMYTADIGVGSPATTLVLDTGSSFTWIGANKTYKQTTTSHDTGNQFWSVTYGDGIYATGEEYTDTVTLNPDLIISDQSIGVASSHSYLDGTDGVLGLGPVDLTVGIVSNGNEVATVMDNLYTQKIISSEVVLGVFFAPASSDDSGGELTFGGYDASKITGDISYVPITSIYPASMYWGIDQSISYGSTSILAETAGVVDTGSTFISIATDAFDKYQSATGATLDESTGLLQISPDQYNQLSSLYFTTGGVTYELTPNGQIWPRSLNTAIGGTTDAIYLVISSTDTPLVLAWIFERFYSVYDTTNSRVGFATTEYTHAMTN
ncbi:acid protease [Suillus subalutaceus]|uniref:acid protease n=1 Tax=Suillus subalutaceus TaxID=48586 RepID=UPI001B86B5F8|nr:acid protease [Suillus subalutaceus]KAG1828758.1 acid protease [Suillus subalutaceus]